MKNDSLKGQYRINEQIRAKEVRIVGDEVVYHWKYKMDEISEAEASSI